MLLRDLPPLLREEPGFASVLGRSSAVLAVPEPARALTIAGLATLLVPAPDRGGRAHHRRRRPAGQRPAHLPRARRRRHLPGLGDAARSSGCRPSVETMGRRLRTMWRLPRPRAGATRARRPGAGARAAARAPRRGRRARGGASPASSATATSWSRELVAAGYRREEVVEHRGEVAVRGSIVDVYPSTADRPVRIDLWGDEVDRLTEFSVADQRSTDDLARVEIFGCRELLPTDEVRERAERLIALEPWGREQWERLAQGQTFDGMESWLPWLTEGEHVLFDLVGPGRAGAPARAPPHARPGRRPAGRGGRPGRHPRQDVGRHRGGRGRRLPAPAPPLRPAADPHRRAGLDRHHRARRAPTSPPSPRWGSRRRPATPSASCASSPSWPATGTGSSWPPTARARPPGCGRCSPATASRPTIDVSAPRAGLHPARHQAGRARRARPHRSPARPPRRPAARVATPRGSSTT